MKTENLSELSDQLLLQKIKKLKTNKIIDATIIGITIGIAIYSAVNNVGFFTFFPLFLAYIILKNTANNKILENEMQKELKSRNLK